MNQELHRQLAHRAAFTNWATENIRYADVDMQAHVNNAVYSTYIEIGRSTLSRKLPQRPPGSSLVVAQQHLVFKRPILYPGQVEIGITVLRIGRSSLDVGAGLFVGDECRASALVTQVLCDPDGHAMPWPDDLRQALASFQSPVIAPLKATP